MKPLIHKLLVVASVAIPLALFSGAAWLNYRDVRADGRQTVLRTTAIMHEHARKVFDTVELVLDLVEAETGNKSWDEIAAPETSRRLRALNARFDQIVSIWIADRDGFVRAGSRDWDRSISIADREFFAVHVQRDVGTYVSGPFTGRATHTPSFAVSRRRPGRDGFDGTVHVALSSAYFESFYAEAVPKTGHLAILIRNDGKILARHPEVSGDPPGPEQVALLRSIAEAGSSDAFQGISPIDGVERLGHLRRVFPHPVYVGFGLDRSAILGVWHDNLAVYGIITTVAALVLLLFSWLSIRRAQAEEAALVRLRQEVAQRNAAEERLRLGQRLEAIGQITGGVAHDFNNLLMIISGGADRLGKLEMPEKFRRYVQAIARAAERGEKLTRQLLTFSRLQPVLPVVVRLADLMPGISDTLKSSLRGNIAFSAEVPDDLWPVKIDPTELELALINVAVNARDAMPEGGRFTLTARNETIKEGPNGIRGDFVVLSAHDTGHGIPERLLGKIFEPFFTTKDIGKGTGLGLSHVYGFATQARGTAVAISRQGMGTEILIYLPRSTEDVTVAPGPDAPPPRLAGPARRVLLVEDNPDVAEINAANFEDFGYGVVQAPNASAALAILEKDRDFDLVFSDIVMPGDIDGIELARTIRQRIPSLPVLLTTGYSEASEVALREGFQILRKPFHKDQLRQRVEAMLAKEQT
jgi:signal transduction histidine kinase